MRFLRGMAILAIIGLTVPASGLFAQRTVEEIIARVNSDIILKSEYEKAIAELRQSLAQQGRLQGAQLEQAVAEQSKHILRELIDTKLLVQVARDLGLNAELDVVRSMERLRQENTMPSMEALEQAIQQQGWTVDEFKDNLRTQILKGQVLNREVYPKIIITTEDIRSYYEANKKNFDRPQGIRIREIAIYTEDKKPDEIPAQEAKAKDALAALKRGDDFAEVAQKYSEAPSAREGGDLGFFQKGQLATKLEETAEKLQKGQLSDILEFPYGFVIIKVEDKHAGGILSMELAQDEIQNRLWQDRVQGKIREYLTKLRADGFIDIRDGYVDTGAPSRTADIKSEKN